MNSTTPPFIFDLDGTLIDNVYEHVLAWRDAFDAAHVDVAVWRIHRRIGMSGGLMLQALQRDIGRSLDEATLAVMRRVHRESFQRRLDAVRPLPGAKGLLDALSAAEIPWAIATSGERAVVDASVAKLDLAEPPPVMVTRDEVSHAKPNPDLFLAAAERLAVDIRNAFVIGDSVWDLLAAQRAGALGIGLLAGGYGRAELERGHAYRVFEDPADLLAHLDELGVRDVR